MNPIDDKPKLKPAPLPPPSGIPGVEIPTGPRINSWRELLPWEGPLRLPAWLSKLFRRKDTPTAS